MGRQTTYRLLGDHPRFAPTQFIGSWSACVERMMQLRDWRAVTITPATEVQILSEIAALTGQLAAAQFYYTQSSWEAGPRHRAGIAALDAEIRRLNGFLSSGAMGEVQKPPEAAPSACFSSFPADGANNMTVGDAEALILRPELPDDVLLRASVTVAQRSENAALRDTAKRIYDAVRGRMLMVTP